MAPPSVAGSVTGESASAVSSLAPYPRSASFVRSRSDSSFLPRTQSEASASLKRRPSGPRSRKTSSVSPPKRRNKSPDSRARSPSRKATKSPAKAGVSAAATAAESDSSENDSSTSDNGSGGSLDIPYMTDAAAGGAGAGEDVLSGENCTESVEGYDYYYPPGSAAGDEEEEEEYETWESYGGFHFYGDQYAYGGAADAETYEVRERALRLWGTGGTAEAPAPPITHTLTPECFHRPLGCFQRNLGLEIGFAPLCELIRFLLLEPVDPHVVWGGATSTHRGQMHHLSVGPSGVNEAVLSLWQCLQKFLKFCFDG